MKKHQKNSVFFRFVYIRFPFSLEGCRACRKILLSKRFGIMNGKNYQEDTMIRAALFTAFFSSALFSLQADDNFCRKCQVLREYHEKNPSKYKYYDDYLKDLEEKGEGAVSPRLEEMPEEVRRIVDPDKKSD
ncbi:putative uncharacterized protein [Waddlia chondrophila 2032/99]|uniref:Uncharacterized protein n=1 Tax=Waddlia chondrophila 2032/99 TaxID=765953 RepID=F8LFE8_9BACT|nr:putative uncharacterized protein [Waddlia chondrophila 2032/99]